MDREGRTGTSPRPGTPPGNGGGEEATMSYRYAMIRGAAYAGLLLALAVYAAL